MLREGSVQIPVSSAFCHAEPTVGMTLDTIVGKEMLSTYSHRSCCRILLSPLLLSLLLLSLLLLSLLLLVLLPLTLLVPPRSATVANTHTAPHQQHITSNIVTTIITTISITTISTTTSLINVCLLMSLLPVPLLPPSPPLVRPSLRFEAFSVAPLTWAAQGPVSCGGRAHERVGRGGVAGGKQ